MKIASRWIFIGLTCIWLLSCARPEDEHVLPGMENVSLSAVEKEALLTAPTTYMNLPMSSELADTLANGRVERVRADRPDDGSSPIVQGWIYYKSTGDEQPVVLCISQTGDDIQWMYCQDETRRHDYANST